METPSSSTRRITRSQTLAVLNNNNNIPISRKIEDSEKGLSQSRKRTAAAATKQQDRSALIDITNDSPIVGLASGSMETPSSGVAKQRTFRGKQGTPGSGETLLRCQVKTLLQKVEEEAELSKLSLESRPFLHHHHNPLRLLAPTPTNTPQILNLSGDGGAITDINGLASMNPSPVTTHEQMISQVVSDIFDGKKQESIEFEKNLTRSLLLDFSEKLEFSSSSSSECSSGVTDNGGLESSKEKSSSSTTIPDDDDSSIWSIQLCEGVSRINVNTTTTKKVMAKFAGKHTRFMYNDEEEIVEEYDAAGGLSPSVLRLQGLPTPKGKHLRFCTEEEESDD
ncbi:hypothetical protein JRO89_XS08G0130000 [Xanthoceras sorbifolium]|uniref:Uncharacterized protein n=1 Tax=Xanthoceras sorbifolium TaxID=99658 RepID=A0ABQ8HPT9_9ROSI|nr:hypothetical protein JRO89_XS08G0130000 [Xanthoceras sorbifolium]